MVVNLTHPLLFLLLLNLLKTVLRRERTQTSFFVVFEKSFISLNHIFPNLILIQICSKSTFSKKSANSGIIPEKLNSGNYKFLTQPYSTLSSPPRSFPNLFSLLILYIMATRKSFRRRKPFRRARRRFRRRARKAIIRRPFPLSATRSLRYCDNIQINAGTVTAASWLFSANNIYDPDLTGTGHSCLGFDELMTVYDHWTVIGSKIKVKFMSSSSDVALSSNIVGVYLNDDTVGSSTVSTLQEQPDVTWSTLGPADGGHGVKTLSYKFSAPKYFHKKAIVGNALYRGDNLTSPTEQAYYNLFAASNFASDAAIVTACVQIDYIVVFTEPRTLSQS
jgi:hypothetical protein